MKKVLGLDIGTNSIGAALINLPLKFEDYGKDGDIEWLGSRIIPTDGDYLKKFEEGQTAGVQTKAAQRRSKRGARRLKHRYKLRRSRLIKVLKVLGWLPDSFPLDSPSTFKRNTKEHEHFGFLIGDYLPFSENTINEFKKEMGIEGKTRFEKTRNKEVDFQLPQDWIIYFLRKKALTQRIEIPELARIIYMMNQRRGFKSSRKDLKETVVLPYDEFLAQKNNQEFGENGLETQFVSITKIRSVSFKEEKKDKTGNVTHIYTIVTDDERILPWEEVRKNKPEWEGQEFTFLVVQKVDKNGKFTQNKPQIPKEDNWALCTTALDEKINAEIFPGKYFFNELKRAYQENRNFKIRQFPVYRWRYKLELEEIWKKQCEFNSQLRELNTDRNLLTKLAEVLYPTQSKNNMTKLAELRSHDLLHIISNDIIYYQRELRSQKNSINECRYEKRKGIDGEIYGLKCIPRSSPLFQEFRIWQDIHNLRILEREVKRDGKTYLDLDVTDNMINETVKEQLFELFNSKTTITEKEILLTIKTNHPNCNIKLDIDKKEKVHSHRINLFRNRGELKGHETLNRYKNIFRKAGHDAEHILSDKEKLLSLWHIDYSITSSDEEKSRKGFFNAFSNIENKRKKKKQVVLDLPKNVIELFCKLPELKKEYGSYSALAIKKMLPLMRCGKYWNQDDITPYVQIRAGQILERLHDIHHNIRRLSEISDDDVQKQVLKSFIGKENILKGLGTYQAGYLVYDKHSENEKIEIKTVEEFSQYIQKEIRPNSLRNPVVEKVIREAMLLVRDIWKRYGEVNEIHIELGRELKNNSEAKQKIADAQKSNFEEKQRIRKLLYELLNDGIEQYVDTENSKPLEWETKLQIGKHFEVKPNPESPVDIDKFRIWRSLSKLTDADWDKKVKEEKIPTEQQLKKYALWLSQNCRSPYTGKIIPLSKLFDSTQYEIEHIIPRKKLKNDSFNNLVIAEWGVNKAKDDQLAANFIATSQGACFYNGIEYKLFTYEEYDAYCKDAFKFQKNKRKNLLATEVPQDFVERQLNDTRYIGRKLSALLSPIVKNQDGTHNENGLLFTNGSITSELRNNWGLNSVWKDIVRPRFERLEVLTGKQFIVKDEKDANKYHFHLAENPKLEIKRLDHRHHALDALVIAATTREHIRYLNTLSAADTDEDFKRFRRTLVKQKIREFKEPWNNFTKDAKNKLDEVIVTFKVNNNIVSQPRNKFTKWFTENGKPIKKQFEQRANPKWMAVRRSMFKEPLGVIWLKEIKEVGVKDAFIVEIERQLIDSDEKRKTAPYIYDKNARQIIKQIITQCNSGIGEKDALITEIETYLKKNKTQVLSAQLDKNGNNKKITVFSLNGLDYDSIAVACFTRYKTKRMSLSKKEYVENLSLEKMKNDFPYFTEDEKRNNALNNLFLRHIKEYDNNPKEAFSGEGLDKLKDKAIKDPKVGRPIRSVTRLDGPLKEDEMFNGGFYETDKGAMSYFVLYENEQNKMREYLKPSPSISTHKAIERIIDKSRKGIADQRKGYNLIVLSPNDLVYVPTTQEREKIVSGASVDSAIPWNNSVHLAKRIYRIVSFSKTDLLTVRANIATPIVPYDRKKKTKGEIGWDNKSATTMEDDVTVKDVCIKIGIDRLGNIKRQLSLFDKPGSGFAGLFESNRPIIS